MISTNRDNLNMTFGDKAFLWAWFIPSALIVSLYLFHLVFVQ